MKEYKQIKKIYIKDLKTNEWVRAYELESNVGLCAGTKAIRDVYASMESDSGRDYEEAYKESISNIRVIRTKY